MCKGELVAVLLAATVATTLAATGADAQTRRPFNQNPNTLRVRFGEFEPDGDSIYWHQREADFTGGSSDFADDIWSVDYLRMLTERWGFLASIGGYEGDSTAAFRDFIDDRGNDILHTTELEIRSVGAGIVYHLFRRRATVIPFIGAGMAYYRYDLSESGEFIDFETLEIFDGTFTADGDDWGWFWLVGLEVPLSNRFTVSGEYRWHRAEDELSGDFGGFGPIDLSGEELSLGVSYRF